MFVGFVTAHNISLEFTILEEELLGAPNKSSYSSWSVCDALLLSDNELSKSSDVSPSAPETHLRGRSGRSTTSLLS